jgi:hypothetical protein
MSKFPIPGYGGQPYPPQFSHMHNGIPFAALVAANSRDFSFQMPFPIGDAPRQPYTRPPNFSYHPHVPECSQNKRRCLCEMPSIKAHELLVDYVRLDADPSANMNNTVWNNEAGHDGEHCF